MADVAGDARALQLVMRIPKTASLMISVPILIMQAEGQGASALMSIFCANAYSHSIQVIRTAERHMMLRLMISCLVLQMDVHKQIHLRQLQSQARLLSVNKTQSSF
jgi:hypothetical protein